MSTMTPKGRRQEFVHPELAELGKTPPQSKAGPYMWGVTRIALGFIFLWAFLDKLFGFGFSTPSERAWVNGGSPTTGYLSGVEGPFAGVFNALAGQAWADWLFMIGLAGLGIALVAGVAMRIAAASGALLLVFMWAASLPIATNPFLDDHLIYALVLIGLATVSAGYTLGIGRYWNKLSIVQRFPFLK